MVRLTSIISRLTKRKVLVIGDLMLDTYTIGKARRISPEAPVAVVHVVREENRAGGAGNVMLNLVSMGAQVVAVGRTGEDSAGDILRQVLMTEEIDVRGLVTQKGMATPVKNRIIAENQQIVRIDHEELTSLPELLEQQVIELLPSLLQGVAAVAISDYGKGFLTRTLLAAIIDQAKLHEIPVITDPKGSDFAKYNGSTIIKPNLSEAYAAAGLPIDADLEQVAEKVLKGAQMNSLMITRAEAGISLFNSDGTRLDFPVAVREVKDVTGAGDTVLAMLTCAMASGISVNDAIHLSNVAAGMAIERFGCARITLSELARHLLEGDVINKVFDDDHLFALQQALKGRKYNLLGISSEQGMTSPVFAAIRRLAKKPSCDLLVYLLNGSPDAEFVDLLASLHDVKFIILHSDHLCHLFEAIQPDEILVVRGDELIQVESPSSVLA